MAQVRVFFNDGTNQYTLPHVFSLSDPLEGMKAVTIKGNRGNGTIVIPGGKESQQIIVRGYLWAEGGGYEALTTLINEMRTKVTTNSATLKLQHYSGGSWIDDWSYTVRRLDEIIFSPSLRTSIQEYEITFLVISY